MPVEPNPVAQTGRNRPIWLTQKIEQTPITDLTPYRNAVRSHTDKSIARLAEGIAEFGFVVPIVTDATGGIISGHGRVEAAKRLGLTVVPTICADHLSSAQIKAYRIAENRLAELSEWNRGALQIEFAELAELHLEGGLEFDLTVTGFDMPQIDLIIGGEEALAEPETVEAPDRSHAAVTQPGDLWLLGHHKILCGDALSPASHKALLGDVPVRMVLTDPPYNVPINGHVRSGTGGTHREFAMASGEMSPPEFLAFLQSFITPMVGALVPGGVAMIFMDWRHIDQLIIAGTSCGLQLINLCVWNKTNGGMGSLYRSKHELVCVFRKPGAPHINNVELGRHGRNRTNVWDYAGVNSFGAGREADLADHPTVKPTALMADAILDVTHRGDLVFDCFGGSGATLLGAEQTGRKARLIELDPFYVDVAVRRWQKTTGKAAVHHISGETFDDRARSLMGNANQETSHDRA